jgi:hypothetical protein
MCLVTGGISFTPRGERLVHRNHIVEAVRLIEVDGYFEWDLISSTIDMKFGCASSRDVP